MRAGQLSKPASVIQQRGVLEGGPTPELGQVGLVPHFPVMDVAFVARHDGRAAVTVNMSPTRRKATRRVNGFIRSLTPTPTTATQDWSSHTIRLRAVGVLAAE